MRLRTVDGREIRSGYVEFASEKPEYPTEVLWFAAENKDRDTGKVSPPSFSFYALAHPDLFALLRDAPLGLSFELHVSTDLLGPIQYCDHLGLGVSWDTSRADPVPVKSYEVLISNPETENTQVDVGAADV
jgi:hypothetical protein